MRFSFCVEENITGLDVTMEDAVLVRELNRTRNFHQQFRRAPDRHRRAPDNFVKLAAFDELHAEVARTIALADLVHGNDTGLIQAGSSRSFTSKTLYVRFARPLTKANDF